MGKHVLAGGVALAIGVMFACPASATTTTTLDFEGAICGPSGTDACSVGGQIRPTYGSTAQVAVTYGQVSGLTVGSQFANFWTTGYQELSNVAYSNSGGSLRVTLTPISNFEVRLVSFDAGCFQFRQSCQSLPWSLTSLSPLSSDPIDGMVINSGTALPTQIEADKLTVNSAWSVTGLVFELGPDMFNGGLDNFVFQAREVGSAGAIPEPASWAMLIGGFGMVGAAMRRRRAVAA